MPRRILHVVSNVAHYDDPAEPTGLWLSELSHAWEVFARRGYAQQLVSPLGSRSPLEPRSLKWPNRDATAKSWLLDAARMALLSNTAAPDAVDAQDFDAIYFTGGHAVMWDFPSSQGLQRITRDIHERNNRCLGLPRLLRPARNPSVRWLAAGRRTQADRLFLAGRKAGRRGRPSAIQRRSVDAPARCPV